MAQDMLGKYLDFAKEQFDKGDYYYALQYYDKALEIDSNSVDILWMYAETLRAYKDYRKAEKYYAIVYDKEKAVLHPGSLLYLGLMQKQNGKYDEAIETFKKGTKKYIADKKGYYYRKSKREIESCLWAKNAIKDTSNLIFEQLPESVNTKNSEFGHLIIDNQLIFSSLRADSISENEEVYEKHYTTNLYRSIIDTNKFEESSRIEQLVIQESSTGNGSFSLDGKRFYFSSCKDDGYNYRCKIHVAIFENGNWSNIDSLGEIINEEGANTTMPHVAEINGKEVLFFASDRKGGEGGLDIYYTTITNGNQFGKISPVGKANSIDNDLTPFWSKKDQRLYFSSSWLNGFGGYDLFYSEFKGGFGDPVNLGIPYNSPANDIYYFESGDSSYITSNRIGVYYSKNPTCCSDIFLLHEPIITVPLTKEETLADLNKRLPVTLYFHNDIPDPRSWDTTTVVNYMDSYNEYHAMLSKYKREYSKGLSAQKAEEAQQDIENFFIEYVDQGVKDLELFRDLLLKELQNGARIKITIQGFASPLAKTNYNVNLTKRRISSLINYLREFDGGIFIPYLDDKAPNNGTVIFEQVPFGEYTANQLTSDNPNDVQNSVYSRNAAIERKIEIQSVGYMENLELLPLVCEQPISDQGDHKPGDILNHVFTIKNNGTESIELEPIEVPFEYLTASVNKMTLEPGESAQVTMTFKTNGLSGHTMKSIYLKIKSHPEKLRLIMTTELK